MCILNITADNVIAQGYKLFLRKINLQENKNRESKKV